MKITKENLVAIGFVKDYETKRLGNGQDWQPEDCFTITTDYVYHPHRHSNYFFIRFHHENLKGNISEWITVHNTYEYYEGITEGDILFKPQTIDDIKTLYYALNKEVLSKD